MSLPFWPINLLLRRLKIPDNNQKPIIIIKESRGAKIIYSLNFAALKLGLKIGQTLVHARAIYPDILVFEANESEYKKSLEDLALWAICYSPHVSTRIFGNHFALVFDITGCAHLFGGEEKMKAQILSRLKSFGIDAHAKIAPTLGAAWALAFYDRKDRGDIDALPINALRLDAQTNERLNSLGINTIGQLAKIPSKPLTRRFGSEVLRMLGFARDGIQEPINPIREIIPLSVTNRFEAALLTMEGLEGQLSLLVKDMCALLGGQNKGARIMRVCFYRVDGVVFEIRTVSSNAHNNFEVWHRLLKQKLELKSNGFDFGFGIDAIGAYAELAETKITEAIDLDPLAAAAIKSAEAVHRLAERLSARIGAAQVCRIYTHQSWVPERAQSHAPFIVTGDKESKEVPDFIAKRRPVLIFKKPKLIDAIAEVPDGPPKQFSFRGLRYKIKSSTPPERIIEPLIGAKTMPINSFKARDYYNVRTQNGARFFIYRAGEYGSLNPPLWFIHGVG